MTIMGLAVRSNPIAGVAVAVANAVITAKRIHPKARTGTPADAVDQALAESNAKIVPIKAAWKSKINWVAGAAVIYSVASFLGMPISAETQAMLAPIISAVVPAVVIVLRTWFNRSTTK